MFAFRIENKDHEGPIRGGSEIGPEFELAWSQFPVSFEWGSMSACLTLRSLCVWFGDDTLDDYYGFEYFRILQNEGFSLHMYEVSGIESGVVNGQVLVKKSDYIGEVGLEWLQEFWADGTECLPEFRQAVVNTIINSYN